MRGLKPVSTASGIRIPCPANPLWFADRSSVMKLNVNRARPSSSAGGNMCVLTEEPASGPRRQQLDQTIRVGRTCKTAHLVEQDINLRRGVAPGHFRAEARDVVIHRKRP